MYSAVKTSGRHLAELEGLHLVLEAFQDGAVNCKLRQVIPEANGIWEEELMASSKAWF